MESVIVYFIGTAGSGKSSLTYAFQQWLEDHNADAAAVNLDPGAETLRYDADIDVRDWVTLQEIMEKYSLGPNGAQIMCADLVALKIEEIKKAIEELHSDYILIDTPGQVEMFAFRKSGAAIAEALNKKYSCIAFLFDPVISSTPEGFTSLLMLSASISFGFDIPMSNLLSKVDLLSEEDKEKILTWSRDYYSLYDALTLKKGSMHVNFSLELFRTLESIGIHRALIPVSAEKNLCMEDLFTETSAPFVGGEIK